MKLSIIIPVYKVEPYLRAGLDSVVREWREGVEVIAVNDGSPDGSLNVLREYEAKYNFITVIDQKNAGVSAARNAGMDIAKGEWITFMDPDDSYVDGAIEYLLGEINRTKADILKFLDAPVDSQDAVLPLVVGKKRCYDMGNPDDAIEAFKSVYPVACNACYRRKPLGDLKFVVGLAKAQDCLFGMSALCHTRLIEVQGTVLYKYFQRPDSCVHAVSEGRVRGNIESAVYLYKEGRSFRWYEQCKGALFRKVRGGVICDTAGLIPEFPADKRNELWDYFFDKLTPLFTGDAYVPPIVRAVYHFAFEHRSVFVVRWMIRFPLVFAKGLLGNRFLLSVWRVVR